MDSSLDMVRSLPLLCLLSFLCQRLGHLQPLYRVPRLKHVKHGISIVVAGNAILILGLVIYGLQLFAEYFVKGRWARNVTALLAGLGLLFLAFA